MLKQKEFFRENGMKKNTFLSDSIPRKRLLYRQKLMMLADPRVNLFRYDRYENNSIICGIKTIIPVTTDTKTLTKTAPALTSLAYLTFTR